MYALIISDCSAVPSSRWVRPTPEAFPASATRHPFAADAGSAVNSFPSPTRRYDNLKPSSPYRHIAIAIAIAIAPNPPTIKRQLNAAHLNTAHPRSATPLNSDPAPISLPHTPRRFQGAAPPRSASPESAWRRFPRKSGQQRAVAIIHGLLNLNCVQIFVRTLYRHYTCAICAGMILKRVAKP